MILAASILRFNGLAVLVTAAVLFGPPLGAAAFLRHVSLGRRLGGGLLAGLAVLCLETAFRAVRDGQLAPTVVALALGCALGYGAWRSLRRPDPPGPSAS